MATLWCFHNDTLGRARERIQDMTHVHQLVHNHLTKLIAHREAVSTFIWPGVSGANNSKKNNHVKPLYYADCAPAGKCQTGERRRPEIE